MGKPALYYATLSPPARAVLLTAKEIGLDLELKPINLMKGEHLTPEFLKMNPQHTIPTLDDDGVIIFDSHAICCYIVDKYAENDKREQLYPTDLVKRANINARLHFDSGHLFARLRFLYEPILYFGSTDCSIDKIAYIQKCYDIMENFLKENDYVCGNNLTIGDFTCIATISSVNDIARIDPSKYPKLVGWIERLEKLPYYMEINQTGADELKALVKETLASNKAK